MINDGIVIGKKILSVAERILIELIEEVEDMQYMRTHAYAALGHDVRSMRYESEEGKRLHEEKMKRQAVRRLKEQKFIKLRKEGDKMIHVLTVSGKVRAIKIAIRHCSEFYLDQRICLVSYDFPEAAKEARRAFRRFLKSVGFKFVQGSVWSINKNVIREFLLLVEVLRIRRWVEVYEARQ